MAGLRWIPLSRERLACLPPSVLVKQPENLLQFPPPPGANANEGCQVLGREGDS